MKNNHFLLILPVVIRTFFLHPFGGLANFFLLFMRRDLKGSISLLVLIFLLFTYVKNLDRIKSVHMEATLCFFQGARKGELKCLARMFEEF